MDKTWRLAAFSCICIGAFTGVDLGANESIPHYIQGQYRDLRIPATINPCPGSRIPVLSADQCQPDGTGGEPWVLAKNVSHIAANYNITQTAEIDSSVVELIKRTLAQQVIGNTFVGTTKRPGSRRALAEGAIGQCPHDIANLPQLIIDVSKIDYQSTIDDKLITTIVSKLEAA